MQVVDRTFVVTGASSGIGQAVTRVLVREGARVAAVARRADRLEALAAELGPACRAIPVDLTTADAPDRIVAEASEAFDGIDGLINCAGRGLVGNLLDLEIDDLDEVFELNFVAPLRLIQRIAPGLIEEGEGVIVNILTPAVRLGLPGIAGYASSKAAFAAATLALRRELSGTGVRVIAVYPGMTQSEYYANLGEATPPAARPAARVAEAILRAIRRNRREAWVLSGQERARLGMTGLIGAISPHMLDRGLAPRR